MSYKPPVTEHRTEREKKMYYIECYGYDFQQYFSYIMSVSFIGGGNQSTRRKPLTCRKVTDKLYHIMLYRVQ